MKEYKLINIIAILFIVNHLLTIALIVFLTQRDLYSQETLKIVLSIIAPLFFSFSVIILRYVFKNKDNESHSTKRVSFLFSFMGIFIPFMFLAFLYYILINQAFHADSMENFTVYLGLVETIFGVFTGYVIRALFEPDTDPFVTNQISNLKANAQIGSNPEPNKGSN